jgi:hypothetical protein
VGESRVMTIRELQAAELIDVMEHDSKDSEWCWLARA